MRFGRRARRVQPKAIEIKAGRQLLPYNDLHQVTKIDSFRRVKGERKELSKENAEKGGEQRSRSLGSSRQDTLQGVLKELIVPTSGGASCIKPPIVKF